MKADPNKKTLIIVESPTKAKTIKKYLPASCTVMASKGHILDLAKTPRTGTYGVDTANGYELEYEMPDDKRKLIAEMRKVLKDSEQLVLASDEDREGESISYHLFMELKPKCPVYRMVFHEITRQAITTAFDNCREIDMNLVHAQEARRAVDRLQGYGISPIISKKLGSAYSAGRVQSPGLKLLVDKEKERRAFKKSDYTGVDVYFSDFRAKLVTIDGLTVASKSSFDPSTGKARKGHVVLDTVAAEKVSMELKGTDAVVTGVDENEKRQAPAIPFTTSTLQQDASRKMKISVRRVMQVAQSLYEKGYITYMRTDSPTLSAECINASRKQVEKLYGPAYLSERVRNYRSKSSSAQEAHEAIRPAGDTFRLPRDTGLDGEELKLYTIIWKRTVATQMAEALKKTTSVSLSDGIYGLSASGTVILFDGFLRVYREDTDEEDEDASPKLPDLVEGDVRAVEDVVLDSHTTEPPLRYNEATLVKTLEAEGIGRPSTYATIISTILDRKYAVKVGSSLVPTFTGFFVSNLLESTFPVYIGYNFTSEMEKGLDDIAGGKTDKKEYLDAFWLGRDDFSGLRADMENVSRTVRISSAKMLPLPGLENSFMLGDRKVCYEIRIGKYGPYLVSDYQEDGKDRMAGIDQEKYFPGTFTDEDARRILFKDEQADYIPGTDIRIMEGKWGRYLRRDSDGRSVNLPKGMDPAGLSEKDAGLLLSLPLTLGTDGEGNEAVLRLGPYGCYASYRGKNIKVSDFRTVTFDDVTASFQDGEKPANTVIRTYGPLDGKPLQLLSGRYGAYIKWGTRNCALTKEEKASPDTVTEERAREIALGTPEKKKTFRRKRS